MKNLLLFNFVMDPKSQVLAWQTKVAFALAVHFDKVNIVTHGKQNLAESAIPDNVTIHVIPPIFLKAPLRWFGGKMLVNFWMNTLHKKYTFNKCFMHMNYQWVYLLSPFFKVHQIPVTIWYAHGAVSKPLKWAHRFADKIVTSTKEGFRIPSHKVQIIGQSIDTALYRLVPNHVSNRMVYVGRISQIKGIEKLIEIMHILVNKQGLQQITLSLIGAPITETDKHYQSLLTLLIDKYGLQHNIKFEGFKPNDTIPAFYDDCFLHLSFSNTGSMDKTLMEAAACGCPVLTCNVALYDALDEVFLIKDETLETIAERVISFYQNQLHIDRSHIRNFVIGKHDFNGYIKKLTAQIESTVCHA